MTIRNFKQLASLFIILSILLSCGSTQKVIMDSGKVYSVKNNDFFIGEKNVTEELTSQQKSDIKSVLQDRLQAEEQRAEELENLNNQIKSLKDQIKTLEDKVETIQDKERNLEKAREAYIDAKMALITKEREFEKLKKNGNLSDKDKIDYEKDILKLREKVVETKKQLEAIR
ncbi:hypothetical protein DFQ05_2305 [Winogradskyella wandonensis]|uniref:Uncharacterized protein n=1 Tax=Winogradskyella wandonensis TaxID=1442586 RepID=A0A4R1KK22_9FLAO|nr:hypothetical protein [Winogradskyella wandonensis]TCK65092.1 hypothetical protein DFQ05_2305 [Winogradskyella wandonensis]